MAFYGRRKDGSWGRLSYKDGEPTIPSFIAHTVSYLFLGGILFYSLFTDFTDVWVKLLTAGFLIFMTWGQIGYWKWFYQKRKERNGTWKPEEKFDNPKSETVNNDQDRETALRKCEDFVYLTYAYLDFLDSYDAVKDVIKRDIGAIMLFGENSQNYAQKRLHALALSMAFFETLNFATGCNSPETKKTIVCSMANFALDHIDKSDNWNLLLDKQSLRLAILDYLQAKSEFETQPELVAFIKKMRGQRC